MGDRIPLAAWLARRLDLAKFVGKGVLLFASQRLTGKHDDVVIAKSLENPPLHLRRQRLCEIEAGNCDTARHRQAWPYDNPHRHSLAVRCLLGASFKNPCTDR